MRPSLTDYYASLAPSVIVEMPSDYMVAYLGVGSTVVGALISGLVSYFIFRRQSASNITSEKKSEKDKEYVQAIGLLLALNEITNGLGNRFNYLQKALIDANSNRRLNADWWEKLSPLPDFSPDQPPISTTDYAILIKIGKINMISSIMELAARFRANEEAFFYANKENLSLRKKLSEESTINPITNEIKTKKSVIDKNRHAIVDINSIFSQLYKSLNEDYKEANRLHIELNEAINVYFYEYKNFEFENLDIN